MICLPNTRLPSWPTWLFQPLASSRDDVVFRDKSPRASTHSVRSSVSHDIIILPNPPTPIELQVPQKVSWAPPAALRLKQCKPTVNLQLYALPRLPVR